MMHFTGERSLEKYKVFPVIAWATFIGFALFVYGITVELRSATENLNKSTSQLEQIVKEQDPTNIKNFEI